MIKNNNYWVQELAKLQNRTLFHVREDIIADWDKIMGVCIYGPDNSGDDFKERLENKMMSCLYCCKNDGSVKKLDFCTKLDMIRINSLLKNNFLS